MSAQLALDALPEWRTRDGQWPVEAHQRGWVALPWWCGLGDEGDIVPAWVCCRCGGVEFTQYTLELNHGCCVHWRGQHGECTWMGYHFPPWRPSARNRPWLPERPP